MKEDDVNIKPLTSTFGFHLSKKHLADDVPEAFGKWVIYTGACKDNCVARNVNAGWGVAILVCPGME